MNETKFTIPGFEVNLPLAEFSECKWCQSVKVHSAAQQTFVHHCSSCGKCHLGMDHHCTFTGNCVGRANAKPFVLFLLYTAFQCLSGLFMNLRYCHSSGLLDEMSLMPHTFLSSFHAIPLKFLFVKLFIDRRPEKEFLGLTR